MRKLKKYDVSPCEMDYLKVISKIDFVEIENQNYLKEVRGILVESMGLVELLTRDGYLFRNKELGIKFYYGKNPLNKGLYLELELSGHYFIIDGYYDKLDSLICGTFNKLGLIPRINRIDLRKDIQSKNKVLKNCFRVFPKFFKKDDSVMMMKGKKSTRHLKANFSQYFNNQENLEVPTGFKVNTSRFDLTGYERLISLDQKLAKGKISQAYFDHYENLYRPYRSVTRIELRLKQESCELANLLFFNKGNEYKKNKSKFFKKVLAHWANGHTIYNIDPITKRKGKINEVFAELFCIDNYSSIKDVRGEIGVLPGLGLLSTAKTKKRDSEYYLNQLAKSLVLEGRSNSPLDYIASSLKVKMSNIHIEKQSELSRFEKTLIFIGTTEEELAGVRSEILGHKFASNELICEIEQQRRDLNLYYEEHEQILLSS